MGLFGNMFDFNGDGKLSAFEKAAEFGAFMSIMEAGRNEELINAGLDPYELEMMDEASRTQTLEEAGLNPFDYDF